MKALFVKDVISQRWLLLFGGFYSSVFFLGLALVDEPAAGGFVYAISGIVVGFMVLGGTFRLDKGATPLFLLSLPVSRSAMVNEKFLLLFSASLYGLVCAALFGAVAALDRFAVVSRGVHPLDVLRVVSGMLLLTPVIPAFLRFGHKTIQAMLIGLMLLGVVAQIVAMGILALTPATFSDVVDRVISWYTATPILRRNLYWLGAGAGVAALSYLASRRLYNRVDL